MSVLAQRFAELRADHVSAFLPFVVAGDPALPVTAQILRELDRARPVAIEVGVPFSDPVADGPTIQRAAQRSLEKGTRLGGILRMLQKVEVDAPLILFSYFNPFLQFGVKECLRLLRETNVAAVLVVDLPAESAGDLRRALRCAEMDLIPLVAPTTSDARLRRIVRDATGFIYAISRPGVTGSAHAADESRRLVRRIRAVTDLPVAVGFGITSRAQAKRVCRYADAAVVGSKIVAAIEEAGPDENDAVRAATRCAKEFANL